MTRLFMGSGLDSFNNSGTGEVENNGPTQIDASFVRNGVRVLAGGWVDTPEWAAEQELWVHYYLEGGHTSDGDYLHFMDGSTVVAKVHKVSGTLRFSYLSALATYTQIGDSFSHVSNSHYDFYFKSGASGEVGVYLNGVEQMTASGSMTYAPDVTKVRWPGISGGYHNVSAVVIDTVPTIGRRIVQGYMSGNGANTAWTGDYSSVDEAVLNEADYIYSGTANQVETFSYTLVVPMTGYTPKAVCVSARIARGSTGPENAQLALRSGGTDYFSSTKAIGLGYTAIQNIWEQNPDTSADWNSGQISALQPGAKSIA